MTPWDSAIVELISAGKVRIPPYPHVALEVNRRLDDEVSSLEDIAAVASVDQVLSAALLRAAGTASMTRNGSLSLGKAIARLGAQETRRIVFGCTFGALARGAGPLLWVREQIWRRAATSAFLAAHLAEKRGMKRDDAFLCGLLHDFGEIVTVATLEEIGLRGEIELDLDGGIDVALDDMSGDDTASQRLTDREIAHVVQTYHVELGLVTATRWNLPPLLVEAIAGHHASPAASGCPELIEVLAICDQISALLEKNVGVTLAQLQTVPGLKPSETLALVYEVAALPARLAPFLAASGHTHTSDRRRGKPQERARWCPVDAVARTGDLLLDVRFIHGAGFVVESPVSLPEGKLLSFDVDLDGVHVSLWGHPRVAFPEGGRYIVDIKPFASSPQAQMALRRLAERAAAA